MEKDSVINEYWRIQARDEQLSDSIMQTQNYLTDLIIEQREIWEKLENKPFSTITNFVMEGGSIVEQSDDLKRILAEQCS